MMCIGWNILNLLHHSWVPLDTTQNVGGVNTKNEREAICRPIYSYWCAWDGHKSRLEYILSCPYDKLPLHIGYDRLSFSMNNNVLIQESQQGPCSPWPHNDDGINDVLWQALIYFDILSKYIVICVSRHYGGTCNASYHMYMPLNWMSLRNKQVVIGSTSVTLQS